MKYGTRSGNPAKARTQCTVVGVYDDGTLTPSARQIDKESRGYLKKILKRGDISGKANQVITLHDVPNVKATRVMLVGLGSKDTMDAAKFAGVARAVIGKLKPLDAKNTLCCLIEIEVGDKDLNWRVQQLVEVFSNGMYSFTEFKGKQPEEKEGENTIEFFSEDKDQLADINDSVFTHVQNF